MSGSEYEEGLKARAQQLSTPLPGCVRIDLFRVITGLSVMPPNLPNSWCTCVSYMCRRYDEEDEQLLLQADADVLQDRQKQQEEWEAAAAERAEYIAQARSFYESVYGDRAKEREFTMTTVTVEQVLDIREEPYNAS